MCFIFGSSSGPFVVEFERTNREYASQISRQVHITGMEGKIGYSGVKSTAGLANQAVKLPMNCVRGGGVASKAVSNKGKTMAWKSFKDMVSMLTRVAMARQITLSTAPTIRKMLGSAVLTTCEIS